jgi:hypothetical protein
LSPQWLEGISAPDLGILIAGEDFVATQDMEEEYRQEITWRGAFGTDGPVLRTIRNADEFTISFSAILTKSGVAKGMNDEVKLRNTRDFEVTCHRGERIVVYSGCNWSRLNVRSTLTEVTLSCDISVPGYTPK